MKQRFWSTLILVSALVFAITKANMFMFTMVLWAIMSAGLYEFWTICRIPTRPRSLAVASLGGLVFLWSTGLMMPLVLAVTMQLLFVCYLMDKQPLQGGFAVLSGQMVSFLYFYGLGFMILGVRLLPDGAFWVLWTIMTIKIGDMGAYLVGKSLGRRKLAPQLSPGKTWEGAVANSVFSVVSGVVIWSLFYGQQLFVLEVIGLAFGLNLLAQLGDLWESLLKRNFDVKDSGRIIPGIGGVIDVVDSLVFAFPLAYVVLRGVV